MKPQTLALHFILTLLLMLSACVSVNLKGSSPTRSNNYQYSEPGRPFEKIEESQADQAWQNPQTGNTIAILSECSETKDPSLATLENETIQALNQVKVLKTQELPFQNRGARRSLVEGSMDGVSIKMDVLTFKKNNCSYTLTSVGRAEAFDQSTAAFESFLKGFKVP